MTSLLLTNPTSLGMDLDTLPLHLMSSETVTSGAGQSLLSTPALLLCRKNSIKEVKTQLLSGRPAQAAIFPQTVRSRSG